MDRTEQNAISLVLLILVYLEDVVLNIRPCYQHPEHTQPRKYEELHTTHSGTHNKETTKEHKDL